MATSIGPLLLQLSNPHPSHDHIPASEIAAAIALTFTNEISPEQTACLLFALKTTRLDRRPDVLAACALSMRDAAAQVSPDNLHNIKERLRKPSRSYNGGLCDIVGTGGDGHNTFNVSTTASILVSPLLHMAKHGNNASTSRSGSADFLLATDPAPAIAAVDNTTISRVLSESNYAFLYAREWHPGMKHVAAVRKQLPFRTIFNLLGPLAHPLHELVEARIIGVATRQLGQVFADALQLAGVTKALIVCGHEELDEISCAGPTQCWYVSQDSPIRQFEITPSDFGLETHPLSDVAGGKTPHENAEILSHMLDNELDRVPKAILDFVLLNAAALLAISGVCDPSTHEEQNECLDKDIEQDHISEQGPGGFRFKEGVRLARLCIDGRARDVWASFVRVTNDISKSAASG